MDFEAEFWSNWVATKGLEWPEDFTRRLDPAREIDDTIAALIGSNEGRPVRILDVGSGPITALGSRFRGQPLDILACDPLADLYNTLLDRAKITPPVRTQFAPAEDLSAFFDFNHFDVVHCQNALDHSFDPVRGIREMLAVLRPGGHIILRHYANEAEREEYSGFHQFNFDEEGGLFVVSNKEGRVIVNSDSLQASVSIETRASGAGQNRYVSAIIKKLGVSELQGGEDKFRARVAELTRGMIGHFVDHAIEKYAL